MSDNNSEVKATRSSKGIVQGVAGSTMLVLLILFFVWITKLLLREPELRYVELCHIPYVVGELFYVRVYGFVDVHESPARYIQRSNSTAEFYDYCLDWGRESEWVNYSIPYINE